ncbi:MAG: type II toxin-antitoxin system VapC family toxin [Candidatus Micrarchaeota archaeon]
MKVLLDTAVLIDILKGEQKAIAIIEQLKKENAFYTTTINVYEVLRGIYLLPHNREKHFSALEAIVSNLYVLDIDFEVSKRAAELYANLRKKGILIDEPDYLIAAACLSNGISKIITRNKKHFDQIEKLEVIIY